VDICASRCTALIDSCALEDVPCAAWETPAIFCVISVEPLAASVMLHDREPVPRQFPVVLEFGRSGVLHVAGGG
jgi:hypothetical protein